MELSKRLRAVADFVTPGLTIADIGTDHGYIPIFLVESGSAPSAVAMDINRGPLERAKAHIKEHGLEDKIITRLSDGIDALLPMEAECVVIAGMGGGLMIHILEQDPDNVRGVREWIFEPQSEPEAFRRFLWEHDFRITKENMVEEDGKFYPVIRAVKDSDTKPAKNSGTKEQGAGGAQADIAFRYGGLLLETRHPVLKRYLLQEKSIKESILQSLKGKDGDRILSRIRELENDLRLNAEALGRYE